MKYLFILSHNCHEAIQFSYRRFPAPGTIAVGPERKSHTPTAAQRYVVESDPSTAFNYEVVPNSRIDSDYGILRAAYRIQATGPALATPEQTARAWMQKQQSRFGWTTTDDLELHDEVHPPTAPT